LKLSGAKNGKMFSFPGLNVVFLTGVRAEGMRILKKPEAIRGGVGKVA